MTRRQQDPLRTLTLHEWRTLEAVARGGTTTADRLARAQALLAVTSGAGFTEAARAAGRRSGDAVAHLVTRFNEEGLAALDPRHGGGPVVQYGPGERERILQEFRRTPDPERDETATWSLTTLARALRQAPDVAIGDSPWRGLPGVSTATILHVLWEAGFRWQRDRTWCATGTVQRRRQRQTGEVTVVDADGTPTNH